ncbi:MAG: FecR domain-containing protein [Bacteroidota bacterium]
MTDRPLPNDLSAALGDRPDADALADTWRTLNGADPDAPLVEGVPSDAEAWADLQNRLAPASAPRQVQDRAPVRPARRRSRWRVGAWATLAVAVVVAAWGLWRPAVVTTGPGESFAHTLPDGSTVELAPASEIRYARGFRGLFGADETRAVALTGEAFFNVETDGRPFVVSTHDAAVTVLGTRFSVRARPDDQTAATRVVLEEGSVRVDAGTETVVLAPGEAVTAGGPLAPEAVSAERAMAWRRGGFAVEDRPLGDVLAEIERQFGVVAEAGPGVPLGTPMTLYYGAEAEAETVVHDLALAAGLRYAPVQGGFRVTLVE